MSTGSSRSFTYPQIEGTLLERVRHNLRLHDAEYNHLTPKALLDELDAAIEAEHRRELAGLRDQMRNTWSAIDPDDKGPPLDDLGGGRNLIEVILRSIVDSADLEYIHKRAHQGLYAIGGR